jgi:Patatin-like phospholipase
VLLELIYIFVRSVQRGLRILVLDGGGSRGMVAVSLVKGLVEAVGGVEVADSFDIIGGTSTGGIISFLSGLRREPANLAVDRYNQLIKQIFVKSSLSTPMMLFTTASYDESHFMGILSDILGDDIMLDSRADPAVPYVFCVASKMSSTPTHVALFRNYNYAGGELADPFTIDPDKARLKLDLPLDLEHELIRTSSYERQQEVRPSSGYKIEGSRHPGR